MLEKISNHLNTNIYSCLRTSGGQSSNIYLHVVHFFNASVNYTSAAAKTVVFLHWCLIRALLLAVGLLSLSKEKKLDPLIITKEHSLGRKAEYS
jgi:hypothetical protein